MDDTKQAKVVKHQSRRRWAVYQGQVRLTRWFFEEKPAQDVADALNRSRTEATQ